MYWIDYCDEILLCMTLLCRYDRFVDAFEHVANMTDDVYKVCMYVTIACMYIHKFYMYLATYKQPKCPSIPWSRKLRGRAM